MATTDKIRSIEMLRPLLRAEQGAGRVVVFTNGCFDLLHVGHARYLAAAREQGDLLVVGINTDRSVAGIKGPRRPLVPERERAEVLAGLACVDYVVLFDDADPLALIRALEPDVLVKGADWAEKDIVGADAVRARGGRVARIPVVPGASTSALIARVLERYGAGGQGGGR